jgi:hypothetical protein
MNKSRFPDDGLTSRIPDYTATTVARANGFSSPREAETAQSPPVPAGLGTRGIWSDDVLDVVTLFRGDARAALYNKCWIVSSDGHPGLTRIFL